MQASALGYFQNAQSAGFTADDDLVFIQNADLEIIKNVSRFDPLPGEVITYTLDLANIGSHDAYNVEITDMMQTGLCYQTGSAAIIDPFRSIGEPTQNPSICSASTGQVLSWTMTGANTIQYSGAIM